MTEKKQENKFRPRVNAYREIGRFTHLRLEADTAQNN